MRVYGSFHGCNAHFRFRIIGQIVQKLNGEAKQTPERFRKPAYSHSHWAPPALTNRIRNILVPAVTENSYRQTGVNNEVPNQLLTGQCGCQCAATRLSPSRCYCVNHIGHSNSATRATFCLRYIIVISYVTFFPQKHRGSRLMYVIHHVTRYVMWRNMK
jgi:hypothetical protein